MGRIDLFHSRRSNYNRCEYWVRDERDKSGSPSQWVVVNQPSGAFYAKPISPSSQQMDVISGVWANDKNHVALETDDDIADIGRGSIVKFDDSLWLVESVQREVHNKESEFCKHIDYKYVLALTKG